jgi:F420-dependent oxidoreductase-like protein
VSQSNTGIDFGLVIKQERRSIEEIEEQWQFAESSGWDSAWGYDHFFSLRNGDDRQPTFEGWTLLAAMAAKTSRLQLGLMVTSNTHRLPSVLAKEAVTVDHIARGRLILGMGAGWNEREHRAYGIPFPSPGERVDRFGEAMELIRQLEQQERTTFEGRFYQLEDAPFAPKPVHGHIPLLIGSTGKRMLRFVARYADLWDGGGSPDEYAAVAATLAEHCREIGRDPGAIRLALSTGSAPLASPDALRRHVASYAAVGVRSFLFDTPDGPISPTLVELSERVIPELRQQYAGG